MKLGRIVRAVTVVMTSLGVLAQATPSLAAPPVKAQPVTATSGKVRLGNLADTPAKPGIPGPITNAAGTSGKASQSAKPIQPSAIDVALTPNGALAGRVVDAKQSAVANTTVSIRQGQQEVARAVTDSDGRFQVPQMKGGTYVVSANNGYGLFRFWTKQSAPPAARDEVRVVSQAVVVRAQGPDCDSGEVCYDDNGNPYAKIHVVDDGQICDPNCPPVGSGGLCCLDCCSLLILGASLAALTIGIIILIDDDDPAPTSP